MAEASVCSVSLNSGADIFGSNKPTSPPRWSDVRQQNSSKRNSDPLCEPQVCSEVSGPHLVNYGISRSSCSVSFLQLPLSGKLVVGVPEKGNTPDIIIEGVGVESYHAVFDCSPSRIVLIPYASATTVDGIRCTEPVPLKRGSMICFGRSHHFKYMCPADFCTDPDRSFDGKSEPSHSPVVCQNPEYFEMSSEILRNSCALTEASAATARNGDVSLPSLIAGSKFAPPAISDEHADSEQVSGAVDDSDANRESASAINGFGVSGVLKEHPTSITSGRELCASSIQWPSPPNAGRKSISPCSHIRIKTNGSLAKDSSVASPTMHLSPLDSCLHEAIGAECSAVPHSPRTRIRTTVSRVQSPSTPQFVCAHSPQMFFPLQSTSEPTQFSNFEYLYAGNTCRADTSNRGTLQSSAEVTAVYDNSGIDLETMDAIQQDQLARAGLPLRLSAVQNAVLCGNVVSRNSIENLGASGETAESSAYQNIASSIQASDLSPVVAGSDSLRRQICKDSLASYERLKKDKIVSYENISKLREVKLDLEHQESETIRQVEVEHALIDGEIQDCLEKLRQLEVNLGQQKTALESGVDNWMSQRQSLSQGVDELESRVRTAESYLRTLEQLLEVFTGSAGERHVLMEKINQQRGVVEQERKLHEDQEFHFMEAEAVWETNKEELSSVLSETQSQITELNDKIACLKAQQKNLIDSIRSDANQLELKRQEILKQMCAERDRLRSMRRQLSRLAFAADLDAGVPDEVDLSSDTEYITNEYIESRLAQLELLGKSSDELKRIRDVTSTSPIETGGSCSSTLRQIERNRGAVLARQGSQVVNEERRFVEQLKSRVKEQATAEWRRRREQQMGVRCASLDSVGGGDSPQSDPATVGAVSDAAADLEHDSTGASASEPTPPPLPVVLRTSLAVRSDNDSETAVDAEDAGRAHRPISDVSSIFEDVEQSAGTVQRRCRRQTSTSYASSQQQQQRPLTRYLPIVDSQLDLRAHIESAAHQLDACDSVHITAVACRGYLLKLGGGRIPRWCRRWFVFDRSESCRALLYYTDSSERRARGGVRFGAIEEVYVDHVKRARGSVPGTSFCVKTTERLFRLMAPSAEAMRIWVDVVMTGAEGYFTSYCDN